MKKIIGNLANKLNKYWIIWIIVITQLVIVFLTYYLEKADKITKEKVDIVFNPKHTVSIFGECKKIMVLHGAEQYAVKEAFPFLNRIYTQIMMPIFVKTADCVVTTTSKGVSDLSKYMHIEKSRFRYVYEGVHERFMSLDDTHCKDIKRKYMQNQEIL